MNLKKTLRCRNALKRLENQYEIFKAAGEDKEPRVTFKNGYQRNRPGRSYAEECKRMATEIANLKEHLKKGVSVE